MHGFYDDKSKATMSEPETITIRNDSKHSILELTKIGCVVYFTYYTTEAASRKSGEGFEGTIPLGYRPTHRTHAPSIEYGGHGGLHVFGIGQLVIFNDRVNGYGKYTYEPYSNDISKRYASGCYITEE